MRAAACYSIAEAHLSAQPNALKKRDYFTKRDGFGMPALRSAKKQRPHAEPCAAHPPIFWL